MIRDELARREVIGQRCGGAAGEGRETTLTGTPVRRTELDFDDEPTLDVATRPARRGLLGRLDARTRSVLAAAAVAAALVNAGVAWAYWHITDAAAGRAGGAVVELNLRGHSDLNRPLTPGRTGNLTVTVLNDNNAPIRITSIAPAPGRVLADEEHRENGCERPLVLVTREAIAVDWEVARNNIGVFTVPDGLTMITPADPVCDGAVFTVPVLASGVVSL